VPLTYLHTHTHIYIHIYITYCYLHNKIILCLISLVMVSCILVETCRTISENKLKEFSFF